MFVNLVCIAAAVSVAYAKSRADVETCKHAATNTCAQQCTSQAPADKQEAIQQCLSSNSDTETSDDFSSCLATQGVTACFKHGVRGKGGGNWGHRGQGKGPGGHEGNPRPQRQAGPGDDQEGERGHGHRGEGDRGEHEGNPLLKSFMECNRKCIKEQNCDDGCEEQMDDTTKEKVKTCRQQKPEKDNGHHRDAMKKCLKSIA